MPPPAVFLIGLFLDLLGYLPIGAGVLTLLVLHGFAVRWRRFLTRAGLRGGLDRLCRHGRRCGGAVLGCWHRVLTFRLLPSGPAVFQFVLTIAVYPALAILFTGAHRIDRRPGARLT